jgi:hypothetical protein
MATESPQVSQQPLRRRWLEETLNGARSLLNRIHTEFTPETAEPLRFSPVELVLKRTAEPFWFAPAELVIYGRKLWAALIVCCGRVSVDVIYCRIRAYRGRLRPNPQAIHCRPPQASSNVNSPTLLTRRQLLSVGGLTTLGLSLPHLLRAESREADSSVAIVNRCPIQ